MLDHPIIDVGIGLIFFYVIFSLVASTIQEWIASMFALRARCLRKGMQNLVGESCAEKVYQHPLVKNLGKDNKLPSYIAPETLSIVLLDIVAKESDGSLNGGHDHEMRCPSDLVKKLDEDHPLKVILVPLLGVGNSATIDLRKKLERWIDEGMFRIAGWYKRQAKWMIFVIASILTLTTNASSIHIAEEIWRNDALRMQISAQGQMIAQSGDASSLQVSDLETLEAFPIGWKIAPQDFLDLLKSFLGWTITTAAINLGAPFWFDLLGKVTNLRGSGNQVEPSKTS
ncbi:MAG: hypothetical protein OXG88_07635 [Gammaproteobacteria bacterium]|nr:hypothetical protein [Gammaproteobacteria bacterium]